MLAKYNFMPDISRTKEAGMGYSSKQKSVVRSKVN